MRSAVNFANWSFVLNRSPEHACPNHLERHTVMCDITQCSLSTIVGSGRVLAGRFVFFPLILYTDFIFIFLH